MARRVVRRERPVASAVPARTAEIRLAVARVREQQHAVSVVDARVDLHVSGVDVMDVVLESVPLAVLERRGRPPMPDQDRKSTRLNSSHSQISYAVFCL